MIEITTRTRLIVTVHSLTVDGLTAGDAITAADRHIRKNEPAVVAWKFEEAERKAYNKIDVYYTR